MQTNSSRIRLLDILRGFAIIGTLGTNIWLFADPGASLFILTLDETTNRLDYWVHLFFSIFINGKLLGLLTIMFGIGLEMKYRKALRDDLPWKKMYLWTMLLLFLDGLLHYILVFEYDILMSYAITGMIVAFLVGCREKVMKRWMASAASIHILGLTVMTMAWVWMFQEEEILSEIIQEFSVSEIIYTSSSYLEQVHFRLSNFISMRFEAIAIIFMNIFLYLVGIRLYRSGAFSDDERGRAKRKKLLVWGLGLGIPLNALIMIPGQIFDLFTRYLFAPVLSLGYIGLLAFLSERNWVSWLLARFEVIGKCALSCYVLQNLLASIIFYSWGFGLAPSTNVYLIVGAWIFITVVMMLVAHIFVKTMGTGPLEWIWRKLSYAPFKKISTK
ncbi:DUF418 domain-containing protein [Alkalicoccobacillus porphyridii]|uniref:DUF418 domain-containing protein n=1 Tax=Alkalicoccobacillus porphyridii TaxID=2597270 RepID=A0A553ZVN4_9BACI|nr:DUF418 domain-containing protein [Alkalicoccobacillus porphyridii]TSB45538.1 DUF418 domain-containing protein [Alkalicoccobacillus porphyridii]